MLRKTNQRIFLILIILIFCSQLAIFRFWINPLAGKEWYVRQYLSAVPFLEKMDVQGLYESRLVTGEKPPLFFFTGAMVYKLLGPKPQNIYWLNIACCGLILLLTYAIGSTLFKSRKAGLFSCLCLALLPNFVIASQEEGMEMVLTLLVCLAYWILARAWPEIRWKHAIAVALLMTVAAQLRKFAPVFLVGPFALLGVYGITQKLEQKKNSDDDRFNPLPIILGAILAVSITLMTVNHFHGKPSGDGSSSLSPLAFIDLILVSSLLTGLFHWVVCSRSRKLRAHWPVFFMLFLLAINLVLFGIRFGGLIPGHSYLSEAAESYRVLRDGRLAMVPSWSRLSILQILALGIGFNLVPCIYFLIFLRPIRVSKALPGPGIVLDQKVLMPFVYAAFVFLIPLLPLSGWMFGAGNPTQSIGNVAHQAAYAPFSGLTPLVMIVMPWFPILLVLLFKLFRRMPVDQVQWFLLSWIGLPLLVFCLVVISRHARHAVALLPAISLLIGRGLSFLQPANKKKRYLFLAGLAACYAFVAAVTPGLGDRLPARILTAPVVYIQARTDASSLPRQKTNHPEVLRSIREHLLSASKDPTLFIAPTLAVPAYTREGLAIYSGLKPVAMNEMVQKIKVYEDGKMPPAAVDLVLVRTPSKSYEKLLEKGFADIETYPLKVHYYTAVAISFLEGDRWQPKKFIDNTLHLMKRVSK